MAPNSSTLAWKIPWMEEPGGLQSLGLWRVGHHWVTSLSLFTFVHWRRKWQPPPVFLSGESQGLGEPGGLLSMGSHRVGHDWSDLAAAAAAAAVSSELQKGWSVHKFSFLMFLKLFLFADWNYERKSTDFICQTETQVCQYSKIWRKSFKSMVC